jgi:hypothetical protein
MPSGGFKPPTPGPTSHSHWPRMPSGGFEPPLPIHYGPFSSSEPGTQLLDACPPLIRCRYERSKKNHFTSKSPPPEWVLSSLLGRRRWKEICIALMGGRKTTTSPPAEQDSSGVLPVFSFYMPSLCIGFRGRWGWYRCALYLCSDYGLLELWGEW